MPTRYLKPGVRDSASIDGLSPLAECLFYRLLVTVDDFGRYDARVSLIKSYCFPVKESVTIKKCDELLLELAQNGLIVLYKDGGKDYLQMTRWDNVPRAKESKFPAYADACMQTYTDVHQLHTDVPLTETETGTKTKTETRKSASNFPRPENVTDGTWAEFVAHRKSKKAALSELVVRAIEREAEQAGWTLENALKETIVRNWQSFKADWVAEKQKHGQQNETVYQRSMRLRMQEMSPSIAARDPNEPYQSAEEFFGSIEVLNIEGKK